jgi:hypothetical protein
MTDKRKHRGPNPQDAELFSSARISVLPRAVADYAWLLPQGYPEKGALKLVGDRFRLVQRQRLSVRRCACSGGQCAE